jgi:hypothetical protein
MASRIVYAVGLGLDNAECPDRCDEHFPKKPAGNFDGGMQEVLWG